MRVHSHSLVECVHFIMVFHGNLSELPLLSPKKEKEKRNKSKERIFLEIL